MNQLIRYLALNLIYQEIQGLLMQLVEIIDLKAFRIIKSLCKTLKIRSLNLIKIEIKVFNTILIKVLTTPL